VKERLYNFVLSHPIWVLLCGLLLIIVAAVGVKNLVFKTDYRVFFSEENPQLQSFESMQRIYSKSDNVAFIVSPKNSDIFTPKNLEAIYWLTNEAWQVPHSTRVDSITNYQHTEAEDDDLIVEDLVLDPGTLTNKDMARLKQIALKEPLLVSKLISTSGHVTVVNITVQLPGKNPVVEVPEIATKVRDIAKNFEANYPGIELQLSGIVMMNNSFAEASLKDSSTLIPLMFIMVVVAMTVLLRTFSGTFATVIVIFLSIAGAMGLAGWCGIYMTSPSASAPTMILTLAVADCVHILSTFFYELRLGLGKHKALKESLRINFKPIFLTSVTTAIGFLSMNFSDSPPFHDLGNIVATGVMLAFVLSVTVFPALLMLLPIKVKAKKEGKSDWMDRLSAFVVRNRKGLLPGMVLIMTGVMIFTPQNELNDDAVKYFDSSVPFRAATDYMEANLSGMTTLEISIDSGESSGVNDPNFLRTLESFSTWLREQPEADHVNTLSDTIKRLNKNMHGDDSAYYVLPRERELSAQYLLLYELSLPYGLDLNNQLNVDKSSVRLVGTFKNITTNELIKLEQRLNQWFAKNAPDYKVQIASPNLMFAHIGQRNIISMLVATALALVLISALLGLALRSFRYGVISLLPNLLPAAVAFGLWHFIDGQIGLGLSVVAGMTLGIVVDDTVHFLSKYHYARNERNKDSVEAVYYAFSSVGRALWITTLVLVAGFMVLAQSSFKMNADMGLLTAITILIALVIDFLFLPPLLMMLDKKPEAQEIKGENHEVV